MIASRPSAHSLTFAPQGTVICDIAAHLPPDTLSGIVYLGGLPFIGPIMGVIGTPVINGFLPGLFTTEDMRHIHVCHQLIDLLEDAFRNDEAFELTTFKMHSAQIR